MLLVDERLSVSSDHESLQRALVRFGLYLFKSDKWQLETILGVDYEKYGVPLTPVGEADPEPQHYREMDVASLEASCDLVRSLWRISTMVYHTRQAAEACHLWDVPLDDAGLNSFREAWGVGPTVTGNKWFEWAATIQAAVLKKNADRVEISESGEERKCLVEDLHEPDACATYIGDVISSLYAKEYAARKHVKTQAEEVLRRKKWVQDVCEADYKVCIWLVYIFISVIFMLFWYVGIHTVDTTSS